MAINLKLNPAFKDVSVKEKLKSAFIKGLPTDDDNFELMVQPFPCLVLKDLVADAETRLSRVETAVQRLTFKRKMNDLFSFSQTFDFKRSKKKSISSIRSFFLTEILPWLKSCTDIPLEEDTIDIGSSQYSLTDVLLSHDDQLEGRRVAFVWYLVPDDWTDSDGGQLDLFNSDQHHVPGTVQRSILPRRNNLVLFEVSPKSWHRVREVTSAEKTRLSINGWFCGPALPRDERQSLTQPDFLTPTQIEEQLLYSWVQKKYLQYSTQSEVHDKILEDSQLLLTDFLHEDKYEQVRAALRSNAQTWERRGLPNSRRVDWLVGTRDMWPESVRALFRLLSSEAMMVVLADMTGLSLHPLASRVEDAEPDRKRQRTEDGDSETPLGKVYGQLRRWTAGCYTLLSDSDIHCAALDVTLFVDCEAWSGTMGGFHSYIVKDEDEELLCVEPTANALALVYRDEETLQFVKYVNHTVAEINDNGAFYDFAFIFTEPPEES